MDNELQEAFEQLSDNIAKVTREIKILNDRLSKLELERDLNTDDGK